MKSFLTILLSLLPTTILALSFELPTDGSDLVGQVQTVTVAEATSLHKLGRLYGIGPREMDAANRNIKNKAALTVGQQVIIPSQFILPKVRSGIAINLAEYRLYFFPPGTNTVETYPVAISKVGSALPAGETKVTRKAKDPWWFPTESEREANPKLPPAVRPGPHNPLGRYAIYLDLPHNVRIHATNKPDSVGTRASFGCFRMDPKDIEGFYERVPVGMKVSIIDEPFRFGFVKNQIFVKVMPPLKDWLLEEKYKSAINEFSARTKGVHSSTITLREMKKMPKDAVPKLLPLDG